MSLRWHELPIEIVRLVVVHAARSALGDSVSWLTQLSLVSRAFYDIVTPVLYATLVITGTNGTLVRSVTKEARLMAHLSLAVVRGGLEVASWDNNPFAGVDEVLLVSNRNIPSFLRPHRLDMHDIPGLDIACFAQDGPSSDLFRDLTHVYLDCPSMAVAYMIGLHESLRMLAKLMHLALDMSRESLDPPSEETFNASVADMLSVILETTGGKLEVLALRVAGRMLSTSRWDTVLRVVASIQDRRLRVWRDDRTGDTTALRIQDARIGRDVWTEAKQLLRGC